MQSQKRGRELRWAEAAKEIEMIECYCCRREVSLVRKVQLRGDPRAAAGPFSTPDDPAYQHYLKETTYRTAFICPGCFQMLDNADGLAEICGQVFNLSGKSRADKAPVFDDANYQEWQASELED